MSATLTGVRFGNLPGRLFQRPNRRERLRHVLAEIRVVVDHDDLPALVDHVGGAGGDARMRRPGDIIFLLDCRSRGRDRERAAALPGREFVQGLEVVARHTDDLRAGLLELVDGGAERMRLGSAAAGEGLGEEIEHDRPLLEHVSQVDLEVLPADRAGGGEIRCLVPDLERRSGWNGEADGCECEQKLAHGGLPHWYRLRQWGTYSAPFKSARVRSSPSPP